MISSDVDDNDGYMNMYLRFRGTGRIVGWRAGRKTRHRAGSWLSPHGKNDDDVHTVALCFFWVALHHVLISCTLVLERT